MTAVDIREDIGVVAYVQIDYAPDTEDPARIFRAMAKLLDAFHTIDVDLASSVSTVFEPVMVLERVEAGSIRAWIRTALKQVPDDALKNLDWKPLIGQYLVRGKHRILSWLGEKDEIHSRIELVQLQNELLLLSPVELSGRFLPDAIPPAKLLGDIRLLTEATFELHDNERVTYVADNEETILNSSLLLSDDKIVKLLTETIISSESRLALLVKKPDYLGNSRWEFKLDDRLIEAKIMDEKWLADFRAGNVDLHPGDALDARVKSDLHRGFEGNVVANHHFVLEVFGVTRNILPVQEDFL